MKAVRLIAALLSFVLLPGCAGISQAPPQRLLTAIELNNQAADALARGEYPLAERLYLKSLAHDRAIENTDGVAINLIGLAVTYKKANRPDDALRVAGLVTASALHGVSFQRLAEAELLSASVLMAKSDWAGAARFVGEVESLCSQRTCEIDGRLANLKAQLAIVDDRISDAAILAKRAIQSAEAANDREELANALRVAANASLYASPLEGIGFIEQALNIDKSLALSDKIFRDLVLMGRLYWATENRPLSAQSFFRARLVAEGGNNSEGLREVSLLERELGINHEK